MQIKNVFSVYGLIKLKNLVAMLIILSFAYQTLLSAVTDNFTVIEKQTYSISKKIGDKLQSNATKVSSITFNQHSSSNFFEQILQNTLSKSKLLSNDSTEAKLECEILHNNVYYNSIKSCTDSVAREVKCEIVYSVIKNKVKLMHDREILTICDTVSIDDIAWLERSEMPFAKSQLPAIEQSWLSQLVTPAIVLGSSILAVVLLFSVRSK